MENNELYKIYGTNLKKFRTNNNFTQEQAAQITKLEAKYISQIERGVNPGTIVTMLKFCKGYNITPNDLFGNILDLPNNNGQMASLNEKINKLNRRDKKLIINLVDNMLDIDE